MEFLSDYGIFAAKFLTVAVVIAIGIGAVVVLVMSRSQVAHEDHIEVKNPKGTGQGVTDVTVDGKKQKSNVIPAFNDSGEHQVQVVLG